MRDMSTNPMPDTSISPMPDTSISRWQDTSINQWPDISTNRWPDMSINRMPDTSIQSARPWDCRTSQLVRVTATERFAPASLPRLRRAAYSGVITAAATDFLDHKAAFSNYGSYIFVDAPGVNIISTYPGGSYSIVSGTSFSAPTVAGTAALVRSLKTTGVSSAVASGS